MSKGARVNFEGKEWLKEWGLWIVVTMVCYVPAFPILAYSIDLPSLSTPFVFAGWGAVAGLIQWLWLRRWVSGAAWWIAATAVGGAILGLVGLVGETLSGGTLYATLKTEEFGLSAIEFAALLGTLVALSQWPLLRRWVRKASLWIPVTGVSWAAGIALFVGAIDAAIKLGKNELLSLLGVVGWISLPGALTGLLLLYLLFKGEDRP